MSAAVSKVAVLGATGAQGGSVAAALANKGIQVVALTRNLESEKAKALAATPNTTVRVANLDDMESLVAAFEGCDGAFIVGNFWEARSAAKEMQQYKNAADALKKVGGMKQVIFSTLEETSFAPGAEALETLEEHETGGMKVPHFDGKARAEAYFEGLPTTFVLTSCYFDNFSGFFPLAKGEDDAYSFTLPLGDKSVSFSIVADIGPFVAETFGKPELVGKKIGQVSFYATGDELAEILSKASGKTIRYNKVSWETYASFGFPGAVEIAQMFEAWIGLMYEDTCKFRDLKAQAQLTDPVEYAKTLTLKFEG